MYRCVVDSETFHYPAAGRKDCCILSGVVTTEMNRAGTFEFQIPPNNVCYAAGKFKKLTSEVEVFWDDDLSTTRLFRGRILDSTKSFLGQISFKCEGWMSVLNDSIVIPSRLGLGGDDEHGINATPAAMLRGLVTLHNSQVNQAKKFPLENVIVVGTSFNNTPVNFPWPSFEKTLDYIQSNILSNDAVGGRMYVEADSIHLIEPDVDNEPSIQEVVQGRNLLDLTETRDVTELYTIIYPVGKDGLTVSGYQGDQDYPVSGDTIIASRFVNTYGRIVHYEDFSDLDTKQKLYNKARDTLKASVDEPSFDVSALDLNLIDSQIPRLKVGTWINVVSADYGSDAPYQCTASSIDICNPANTKYTIGRNMDTLTSRQHKYKLSVSNKSRRYASEISSKNITANVYNARVRKDHMTFYKSNNTIYLSFEVTYLKEVPYSDPTIMTFSTNYAPVSNAFGTAIDETNTGTYTLKVTTTGQIQVLSSGGISLGDIVTGNLTWMAR